MSEADVKQCPLNKEYKFRTACKITSCKYYSSITKNHCLAMDIKFSSDDKTFSDSELLRYKFPDKEVNLRDVTRLRKRSVESVKNLLTLYHLIQMIRERYSEEDGMPYTEGKSRAIDTMLRRKPLSIDLLDFQPWMLKFLLDEEFVNEALGYKFKMKETLKLKTKDYSTFVKSVQAMSRG